VNLRVNQEFQRKNDKMRTNIIDTYDENYNDYDDYMAQLEWEEYKQSLKHYTTSYDIQCDCDDCLLELDNLHKEMTTEKQHECSENDEQKEITTTGSEELFEDVEEYIVDTSFTPEEIEEALNSWEGYCLDCDY